MNSIARWLLIGLLSALIVSSLTSAYVAYRSGRIEAGELFDAKLAHSARVLRSLLDDSFSQSSESRPPIEIDVWSGFAEGRGKDLAKTQGHAYETKLAFQVWSADRQLLLRSRSAPEQPLATIEPGFHTAKLADGEWRSFVLQSPSGRWFITGERDDARKEIAHEIAEGLLIPLLLQIPVLGILFWWLIELGKRSLKRVVAEVETRGADRLQPLELGRVPDEITPLVSSINRLLHALSNALDRERRFTADAAHELRTPLAALQVHLDNLRTASSGHDRDASQRQLSASVLRLRRIVEQLLSLSRLEPDQLREGAEVVDVKRLATELMAEFASSEAGKTHSMEMSCDAELPLVRGWPSALEMLLRNLIDNALRYSPAGAAVRLSLRRHDDALQLVVEDAGPGVEPAAYPRVMERFHRELGSGVEGSGLGLSIVSQVVALHAARLQLGRSLLGGLSVSVSMPAVVTESARLDQG